MTHKLTSQERSNRIAQRMKADAQAPRYHFIAPEGNALPFDPNGALYWKGKYHLFYIFQDPELPHGGHCWGHAFRGYNPIKSEVRYLPTVPPNAGGRA